MPRSSSTELRELIASGKTIVKPGAYNALSARLVEQAGFKAVGVSGYGVSVSLLGKPDLGFLTMGEMVTVTRYIVSSTSIPVIADADTGFGNALNVMRTTEEFIMTGAAGIHIEDQVAPKRCGHVAGKQVISIEEACGKFRAAARVRDDIDPDFVLIARTDVRGQAGGSLDEVIERSKAYLEAGADMVFPEGLLSEEELVRVCEEVPGPIHYNRTGVSPILSVDRLQELGVTMVSNATGTLRSAAHAMMSYLEAFQKDDSEFLVKFAAEMKDHPIGNLHEFVGFSQYRKIEEEFLSAEETARRYAGSIGFQP